MTAPTKVEPVTLQPLAKPPQAVLGELINGYWVTQSLHAAAALGIADRQIRDAIAGRGAGASARPHARPWALERAVYSFPL